MRTWKAAAPNGSLTSQAKMTARLLFLAFVVTLVDSAACLALLRRLELESSESEEETVSTPTPPPELHPSIVAEASIVDSRVTHPVGARIIVTRRDRYFQRKGVIVENKGATYIEVRLDHIPSTPYTRECPSTVIKKIPKCLCVTSVP